MLFLLNGILKTIVWPWKVGEHLHSLWKYPGTGHGHYSRAFLVTHAFATEAKVTGLPQEPAFLRDVSWCQENCTLPYIHTNADATSPAHLPHVQVPCFLQFPPLSLESRKGVKHSSPLLEAVKTGPHHTTPPQLPHCNFCWLFQFTLSCNLYWHLTK